MSDEPTRLPASEIRAYRIAANFAPDVPIPDAVLRALLRHIDALEAEIAALERKLSQ